jgi:VCBS repeat-containing protein
VSNETFFLQGSVAELEGRVGSEIVNGSEDDNYRSIDLGFNFKFYGIDYSSLYPGSNTYITAGDGSGQYYGLSLNGGPPLPGIHLGSSDNSWQRVWSYFGPDASPDYWRIRYEGTASTGGSPDYPNIVYEATYFNPSLTGDKQYVEVVFGIHNRTDGVFGVTDGSSDYLAGGSINDYMSYVFESDLDGRNWRILEGYSIASGQLQANSSVALADAGSTLAYTEGDGEKVIDSSLSISDDDDTHIESASVTISSGFKSSEDVLSFQDANGITGAWNASTGILTLTGSATKAQYEQALQSVTYTNTNTDNPDSSDRTISWVVNDGDSDSTPVTSTIIISRLNDAPEAADKSLTLQEDQAYTFSESDFSFADVDSGDSLKAIRITSNPSLGQLRYDDAGIDAGTSGYTVFASDIDKLSFTPGLNENGSGYASFSFKVVDQSDAESATATIEINVDPVNDEPNATNALAELQGVVIESGHNSNNGNLHSGISAASGQLNADNVDAQNGDELTWSIVGNGIDDYGQISIDSSSGEWTYTLDNAKTAVQSLLSGDERTSEFVARVSDKSGLYFDQTINVTIRGSDDIIRQFADHVIGFSSAGQADGGDRWAAIQALGAPNTTQYGDLDTAWSPNRRNASGGNQPDEFLAVGFRRPVKASGFVIHENYGNGFVRRVHAVDINGNSHQLWEGQDNSPNNLAGLSVVLDEPTDYVVRGLKIWVDIDHAADWEQIDAIELIGWATQETYQPLAPTLEPVAGNDVINAAEKSAGITLTGQAEANSTVEVSWGGFLHTASVGSDRKWSLSIAGGQIPSNSTNSSIILVAIDSEGKRSSQYTRTVRISSAAPSLPEINTIAGDNRINTYEKSVGVTLQGRAIGCTEVEINWDGRSFGASVSRNGYWSILIGGNSATGFIPNDSVSSALSVVGIDADGNRSDPSERQLVIDTGTPTPPTVSAVTADNTINAAEKLQGITLNGQAESGTIVRLEWGASAYMALVESNGHWSVAVPASAIPADDPRSAITMRAVDVAGNQSIFTRFRTTIDTAAPENPVIALLSKDDILNSTEVSQSLVLVGTAERDSLVDVSWNGHSFSTSTNRLGRWALSVDPEHLPAHGANTTIAASAIDAAGNRSGIGTRDVLVDTAAPNVPILKPVGLGGVINASLKSAGLVISGEAEASSTIHLTWERLEKQVTVPNNGEWSLLIPKGDVPRDGSTNVIVTAVDAAGNTSEAVTQYVFVDTKPFQAPKLAGKISGDGVLTAAERDGGLVVSGTSEAGTSVDITFAGLTRTASVTGGRWQVIFNKTEIPVVLDQRQLVHLVARDSAGNVSEETKAEVVLRTAPPAAPLIDEIGSASRVNAALKASGVIVSGQSDDGVDRVALSWGDNNYSVPVNRGRWRIKLASSDVPADGTTILTAVAFEGGVPSAPSSQTIEIDTTPPNAPSLNSVGQAGIVNAALKSSGLAVSGQSEVGATISVLWGRLAKQVTTAANGVWTLQVPIADFPQDGLSTISVTTLDQYGNRSLVTEQNLVIDCIAPAAPLLDTVAGDDVINTVERANGIMLTGRAEARSSVAVNIGGVAHNVITSSSGRWSLQLATNELPTTGLSTDVRVVAIDAAGNQSAEMLKQVGLAYQPASAPSIDLISSDNIVNAREAQPLKVDGAGDAGSEISLMIGSTTRTTTVDQSGRWSLSLRANQIPSVDGSYQLLAIASNRSGLSSVAANRSVMIDRTEPSLVSATVEGASLILDFSEAIRTSAVSPNQFAVIAGRNSLPVQSVGVDSVIRSRLVLQLAASPVAGTDLSINYEPNQAGGQVSDLAGNPITRIRGIAPTTFRSASDVVSLANGYRFLQLTGSGSVQGVGNSADNTIVGNIGDNVINGGLGADELTGLGGRDRFLFLSLGDSFLGSGAKQKFDRITDFAIGTDVIDGPSAVARGQVSVLSSVAALDSASLGARLTTEQFKANCAAVFSLYNSESHRWFVALNDAIPGFDAGRDALVEITGFTGQLVDLQVI